MKSQSWRLVAKNSKNELVNSILCVFYPKNSILKTLTLRPIKNWLETFAPKDLLGEGWSFKWLMNVSCVTRLKSPVWNVSSSKSLVKKRSWKLDSKNFITENCLQGFNFKKISNILQMEMSFENQIHISPTIKIDHTKLKILL